MDADAIRHADALARRTFTYTLDPAGKDNWRSHADDALAGRPWFGDCDDLASTVLDLLGREGLPLENRYRLMVSVDRSKIPDHIVACVLADDGAFKIVGDTYRPCYPAAAMLHRGIFYNRLSETRPSPIWREGLPWQ